MSLYSIDKLIEETRRLAAEFKRTTGAMLPVTAELARYDVARHLDLILNEQRTGGYDATGTREREGLRVQIKGRVVGDSIKSGHRIGQLNTDADWDLVILSLMDENFEPFEMYQATRAEILQAMADPASSRGKRGAVSIAKFRIIGELVWTRENGLEKLSG
jgi:hypothetical protein